MWNARHLGAWCLGLFVVMGSLWAQTPTSEVSKEDLKILKDVGLATDGKALLDYLRKQTFPEADPKQMEALIRELGDDEFKTRESAFAKLIGLGKGAIVGIKQAAEKDADPEIKKRAEDLRKKLEAKVEPAIQVATARILSKLKPEGSAEVLIAFLPFSADLTVTDEVCKALGAVTVTPQGIDPAVVKALDDKHPLKRGAAGEALARAKADVHLPAVRNLLKDSDPLVRVRAGTALVVIRDPSSVGEAIPALIECMQHLPPENLWAVEDILVRLAGEGKSPTVSLGTNELSREACFKAWSEWYGKNNKDIVLARLDQTEPMLGNTLIVYQNFNRMVAIGGAGVVRRNVMGEVIEVDQNKKVLWKLEMTDSFPVDAMVLPDKTNKVAIAEYQKARVSIRDTQTKNVDWEFNVGGNPIGIQALPGGKIFVVLQNRLLEIDTATRKETTILTRQNHDIFRAKKTRSGDVIFVTNQGSLVRLDSKGATVKQFQVPQIPVLFGNIDILPNGNILIPDFQNSRVVEYNMNGNQVGQIETPSPSSAIRLPNGNTLIASQNNRKVAEINRAGQAVWQYDVDGQVFNARRR